MENVENKKLRQEELEEILTKYINRGIELQGIAIRKLFETVNIKIKDNATEKEHKKYRKKTQKYLDKNHLRIEILEQETEEGKKQFLCRFVDKECGTDLELTN